MAAEWNRLKKKHRSIERPDRQRKIPEMAKQFIDLILTKH